MSKKKKIGILTLRVDNNYGGHLQRYAMSRILKDLGYTPVVLFLRSTWKQDPWKYKAKKAIKNLIKTILRRKSEHVFYWLHEDPKWEDVRAHTYPFFCKYVNHSPILMNHRQLIQYVEKEKFDGFIVGSDQVWRKAYTQRWGVERFFLDFAPIGTKKVAYAASFGLPEMEYEQEEIIRLHSLYNKLDAVSVREDSGIDVLQKHGWTNPKAIQVLDPTMLLPREHYEQLVKDGNTIPSEGNMFCYVLDPTPEIQNEIESIAKEKGLQPFYAAIDGEHRMSVEQWLRSFMDSEFVVANSYHGVVFALIFNKPFRLIYNEGRGSARFDSLIHTFGISTDNSNADWKKINDKINEMRQVSLDFITDNL